MADNGLEAVIPLLNNQRSLCAMSNPQQMRLSFPVAKKVFRQIGGN